MQRGRAVVRRSAVRVVRFVTESNGHMCHCGELRNPCCALWCLRLREAKTDLRAVPATPTSPPPLAPPLCSGGHAAQSLMVTRTRARLLAGMAALAAVDAQLCASPAAVLSPTLPVNITGTYFPSLTQCQVFDPTVTAPQCLYGCLVCTVRSPRPWLQKFPLCRSHLSPLLAEPPHNWPLRPVLPTRCRILSSVRLQAIALVPFLPSLPSPAPRSQSLL